MSGGDSAGSRRSFTEGLGFGALSFAALALLGLASSVAIARLYGVTVLGEYALASAPVGILFTLSSAREQVALVRELATLPPRAPRVTGLFYAVLIFSFGLTAALATATGVAVYLLFRGPIHQPALVAPTLVFIAGYTVIQNTCWNADMVFSAFGAGRELFWTRLTQAVAFIALAVFGGVASKTIWALVAATVLSYLASLVHKVVRLRRYMGLSVPGAELRRGIQTLPTLIRFGLKIAPGQVADGVSYETGTFTLALLAPVAAIGAYGRALQLARRFLDLQWKVTEMLFPTLVRRRAEEDHDGFDRALIDSARYSLVAMLLPAAVIGGAATGVMRVFGPGFSQAGGALAVLMLMPALTTMSVLQRGSLIAVDRPWTTAISGAIRMLVTIAATIWLALAIGATGAALGILLGTIADLAYTSAMTRRHLHRPLGELWPPREMASILVAYGVGFFAARMIYGGWASYPGLGAALMGGALSYAAAFFLCGGVTDRDRARLAAMWASFRRHASALAASG
jgi:O-antigen/teichoic acid export membrane protein